MFMSHLNVFPLTGQPYDLHSLSHQTTTLEMSKAIAWHVQQFGYLIAKLRDTAEGPGSMLDNTAAVLLHEGGHGTDPYSGRTNSAHSTDNMACLIAGRVGGLHRGVHLPAPGQHPASVLITAMNAVGVPTPSLGEVSGEIAGLRS
jgi:hypothetical protein